MPTFDDVLHVRLGSLSEAVTQWSETITKLEKLEEEAREGLLKKAGSADWKGENAGVTLPFVRKTAKEFADAAKEATSIRNVLRDAHTEFKSARDSLKKVVEEAPAKGLQIFPDGVVGYQVHPDRRSKDYDGPEPKAADFEAARSTIKAAVDKATEADDTTSRALKMLVGKDKHNFSGTEYDDLKEASRAQDAADAKEAAKIVEKGDDATPEEIDRLNKYFEDNKGDPYFAERFALDVGAKGNLEYWADLGDPSDGSRLGLDHQDKLKELQKNWSLTLAAATHSTSPEMDAWKSDTIKAGDEAVRTRGTSPYGFQVMSSLMREGNFEKGFLRDYGNALVVTERQMTHDGRISPDHRWFSTPGGISHLNWSGTDNGRDPMTGFMEALGHNPKASTEFFNSNIDLTPDDSKDDKKLNAFEYFTEDRDWPEDITGDGQSNKYGHDSLGHALESATLGHSYDDPNAKLNKDADTVKLMEKVVEKYGGDPELLKKQESLADSLGRMGAGYIDDINWALNDNDETSMFAPGKGEDGHAEFGKDGARQFLSAVGKHPDGYAELGNAEKIYSMSMLNAQVGPDGEINESHARETVRTGGEVQGMLDQARADQVKAEGLKADEEYNKALEDRAAWIELGAGAVVAGGAAFLPPVAAVGVAATLIPVAQDTATGVLEQVIGDVVGGYTESNQQDSGEDIQKQRAAIYAAGEATGETQMRIFRDQHGIKRDDSFGQDLEEAFNSGYDKGNQRESQQGSLPQTG